MSQTRKLSVDSARRGVPKAHIPYRADDLTHGKKTGVNVRVVDRKSDGFESFGEVLVQADGVTPPHMRTKRHTNRTTNRTPSPAAEFDENGEMSMDLDDPNTDTPREYFKNAQRPSAPSSANRSTTSSHPVNRSSVIDYDRVPSPRPSSSSQRQRSQQSNGNTTPTSRFKSNLSQTVIPSSPEEDEDDDRNDSFGDIMGNDDYHIPAPDPDPDPSSSPARRTSFTEMDQDEEDDPQPPDNPRVSSPPRRIDKGKQKEILAEEDQVEDEIAQGLDDMDNNAQNEVVEMEERHSQHQSKPKRRREEEPARERKPPNKRKKVQLELPLADSSKNVDGVRRGTRARYKPLEYWRCEKVVYGRRESGISMVPVIKDIIRLPKEPVEPLGSKGRRGRKPRSRSKPADEENNVVAVYNPEEGWDDEMDPYGVVLDFDTQEDVQRRVAFTSKMVTPRPAANNDFSFQKIFGDGEFIAAGQLIIPVGGKKPSKGTKDNTYVFYLIEGAINLRIHRTSFVLATGGMFLIPRGNAYYMENISQRPAKLFFSQARKVAIEEVGPKTKPAAALRKSVDPPRRILNGTTNGISSSAAKSGSMARSSSIGQTSSPDKAVAKPPSKRAISK